MPNFRYVPHPITPTSEGPPVSRCGRMYAFVSPTLRADAGTMRFSTDGGEPGDRCPCADGLGEHCEAGYRNCPGSGICPRCHRVLPRPVRRGQGNGGYACPRRTLRHPVGLEAYRRSHPPRAVPLHEHEPVPQPLPAMGHRERADRKRPHCCRVRSRLRDKDRPSCQRQSNAIGVTTICRSSGVDGYYTYMLNVASPGVNERQLVTMIVRPVQ
jgi:hypothetical protein